MNLTKLEPLELLHFDGNFLEYPYWRSHFKACILDHQAISASEKVLRLKSCLASEPLGMIQHKPATPQGLLEAMKILDEAYGSEDFKEDRYYHMFNQIKDVQKYDLKNLQALDNTLEMIKSENPSPNPCDVIWVREFIQCLSDKLQFKFRYFRAENDLPRTIPICQDFLKPRLKALREMQYCSEAKLSKPISNQTSTEEDRVVYQVNLTGNSQKPRKSNCICCHKDKHKLEKCKKFNSMSRNERANFASEKNICFACLDGTHEQGDCKESPGCVICHKANHHTLLHIESKAFSHMTTSVNPGLFSHMACIEPVVTPDIVSAPRIADGGEEVHIVKKLETETKTSGRPMGRLIQESTSWQTYHQVQQDQLRNPNPEIHKSEQLCVKSKESIVPRMKEFVNNHCINPKNKITLNLIAQIILVICTVLALVKTCPNIRSKENPNYGPCTKLFEWCLSQTPNPFSPPTNLFSTGETFRDKFC